MIFDVKSEFGGCIKTVIVKRRIDVHHNYLFMSCIRCSHLTEECFGFNTYEKCLCYVFAIHLSVVVV